MPDAMYANSIVHIDQAIPGCSVILWMMTSHPSHLRVTFDPQLLANQVRTQHFYHMIYFAEATEEKYDWEGWRERL